MTAPALSPAALADACARWGVSALDAPKAIREVIDTGVQAVVGSSIRYSLTVQGRPRVVWIKIKTGAMKVYGETNTERLLALIRKYPGRSLNKLAECSKVNKNGVRAIVATLEASGQVRVEVRPVEAYPDTPARLLWPMEVQG